MIAALWLPFVTGLGLTFAIEALLRPAPRPAWRRHPATLAVHLGSWTLLFALFLLVLQRPWFATAFIASLQLVIVQASNTKSKTLNEPFICQDFEYFLDALRHPRLYVPFFGIGLAVAASAAGALAIAAFLWLEASLVTRHGAAPFLAAVAALLLFALPPLWGGLRHQPDCRLVPQRDLAHLGLFSALWAYGRLALAPLDPARLDSPFAVRPSAPPAGTGLPDLVVVQSEAFFDPRDWCPLVRRDLLPHFDALRAEAIHHGRLRVPAWGANTVRTESAFLTGLGERQLGIHRFNPYRQLARRTVPNLADTLRRLGYRTVCVHPYPAGFYLRDRVMPRLGFERFLDITHFDPRDRDGQYIGDLAVAEKVGRLLEEADNRPLFVFVITMENHGPLHLERPVPDEAYALLGDGTTRAREHDDLAIYLRHLVNADRMVARLRGMLTDRGRPGVLCWYGDHVPIIPQAYRRFGAPDGQTDYAIWSTRAVAPSAPREREVTSLGPALLDTLLRVAAGAYHEDADKNDTVGQTQSHQEQE